MKGLRLLIYTVLTHSSCRDLRMAGMLVADGGRAFTSGEPSHNKGTNVNSTHIHILARVLTGRDGQ